MTEERSQHKNRIDWDSVAKEANEAFGRFVTKLHELPTSDKKWTVEGSSHGPYLSVAALYDESFGGSNGTGVQTIKVSASISEGNASGLLTIGVNEAWILDESEKVVGRVSDQLTRLLEESGLNPKSNNDNSLHGRNSYRSFSWKIYPNNHPKITNTN